MKAFVLKRALCVLLAVLCLTLPLAALAEAPEEADDTVSLILDEKGSFFSVAYVSLTSNSANHITVTIYLETLLSMNRLGYNWIKIQKWNGTKWVDVYQFSGEYDSSTTTFSRSKTLSGTTTGTLYLARVSYYARFAPMLVETNTMNSNIETSL